MGWGIEVPKIMANILGWAGARWERAEALGLSTLLLFLRIMRISGSVNGLSINL